MMIPTLKTLVRSAFLASAVVVFLMSGHAFAAAEADLLVAYDQTYPPTVGGSDNVQVLAANAIAGSNLINERCGTGARVRIVGYHQAAQYSYQASSKGGYVGWMANYDSRLADVVDAGNARAADLVAFLCVSTSDGAAAVAQQPGRYSAFDPGQFWSTVVAHELAGHNYGCDHKGGRENPKTVMLHNYCGGGAQAWYSNPNIWLNGTRLLGEGSCLGAAVSGGDNSLLISNNAQGVADRYTRVVTAPNLGNVVQRWAFNQAAGNAPAGTTVTDSVAATLQATVQGNGAIFTGSGLRLPGGASGSNAAYLQLPSGVISKNTNATIEIWASPLSAPNWSRIADFNNGTSNYLTLTSAIGTDITAQRFESKVGGTTVSLDSDLPTTAGVQHLYTITYASTGTATGRWTWYRDGDEVAFLDVAYALSALSDVNNWLGRSAFSADAFANCEYAEVRISNVAMSRDEILANYELGPNRTSASANLTMDDALGSTSFNSAGHWSDGLAPAAGNSYETYNFRLRTPADTVSRTFAGKSLKLSGGCFTWKGTSSNTITVNDLTLSGDCEVLHAGSGTWTLAGNLKVDSDSSMMRAANGPINLTANLTGASTLLCVNNTVTLGGTNTTFSGKIAVGDGRSSSIAIDSEARLGPNPPTLVTDQLTFNRGVITTSGTLVLDDPNRGILFDVNGGTFNVASGTTTLSCPLYSPDLGTSVVAGGIAKGGLGTLILSSPTSTFSGTLCVDTASTTSDDGIVRVVNNQVLANAHNPIYINNNTTGSSRLQIDGSSGGITLTRVSLAGRNGVTPAVQNLGGTNNVGGLTVMAGGTNHIVQSDSGLLNFTGSIYSGATGTQNITFQGSGDIATLSTISELTADLVNVVKIGGGTLTLEGECSHDGTTTLSGGTLRLNGSMTTTTGATTTAVGTTFAGTGTTSSPTRIGGIHAPGNSTNSTGTQTFTGALTYSAAAKLNWSLVANGTAANSSNKVAAQTVTVDAGAAVNLVFNGAGSAVNFTNVYWTQPHSWSVLTATAMGGQFALGTVSTDSAGNSVSSFGSFSLQQTATDVKVNYFPLNATPPSVPTGLSSAASPSMAALAWVAPIGATSYNVKRSSNSGGPYETIATGVIATTFTDTSVTNGTTYYYVITALNPFGESGESAEIFATPHLPATINKASNTTYLNLPGSWTGGILPNAWDTAVWSGLAGANSVTLGSNMSLKGITVATNGGAVSIGAGNTLTVGMGGIDLSAATQNLTLSSGLTIGTGHQVWNVASARTLTLNTGAFTRTAGATLNIQGAGTVASSMTGFTNTNGILGSWATIGTGASTLYATLNAGVIAGLTGTSSAIGWTSTNNNTFNYDVSATAGNLGVSRVANTVRYTGAAASQNYGNSNTTTLTLNGLLNVGTGTLTLTQAGGTSLGQVLIGTNNANELDLIAANAEIAIAIPIMNTGTNAGSVIIAGPNTVTLSGSNTFTGGLSLNSGTLQIGNDSALSSGTLTIYGGAIRATGASRTIANNVVLNGDFTLGRNTAFTGAITLNDNVTITSANPDVLATTTTTFSGIISGSCGLTFTQGANPIGTIALNAANTYSGGTTLAAGNLQLGNASGFGATTGALIVNGGTLNLNAFSPTVGTLSGTGGIIVNQATGTSTLTSQSVASATFAGSLQNGAAGQVLSLTKKGSGTLTLTGSSSYTGATTVSAGKLCVTGSLSATTTTVAVGATLGGSGSIAGAVTCNGILAPGVSTETLTLGSGLVLTSTSTLDYELGTTSDRTVVTGNLTLDGTVNVTAGAGFAAETYTLITYTGTLTNNTLNVGTLPAGFAATVNTATTGQINLVVTSTKTTPTITVVPTATAITYGQTLSNSSLTGGTASVAGTFAFTAPNTTLNAGTASQSVTFTPTDSTNYDTVTTTTSVTVNKATPTISVAPTASAITYGQALSSSSLTGGTASVAGFFAFTTPATTPNAGTASQSMTFTPTDSSNYNTVTTTTSVTVNKATPTISIAPTASAITYGQALSNSSLSGGTASVAGTFAFITPATTPNAGTASQSVTFTPTDSSNYNTVTTTTSVTVNKSTPTVSVAPTASAITYGQTLSNSSLTGGTASVAGSFAFTTPATTPNAGTASQSVTFTPTDSINYNTITTSLSVTVNEGTAIYQVTNVYSGDGSEDVLFQNADGSLLDGGIVAIGYFPEDYSIPDSLSQANIASAVANFTPLASALCGGYSISLDGSFSGYVEGEQVPGENASSLIGRPLYVFVGNASTLAASTSIAIHQMAEFGPNNPPLDIYYGAYVLDFIVGAPAPLIGQVGTFTGIAWQGGEVSTYQTLQLAGPPPATITTPPMASTITYGQTLASSSLSGGVGSVPGSFAFSTPSTIPGTGTYLASYTFIPTDTVAYTKTTGIISVLVNKATPTVSISPTASAITYGQALWNSSLSGGTASVAGTFAFTTSGTTPDAGTVSQSVVFFPTDSNNYDTAATTVSVTVNKAVPSVNAAPMASAITYGQALSNSSLSGGTASVAGTFNFTTPSTTPNAGAANQGVTFTPMDSSNYSTVTTTASVTVNKATPTVSISPTAEAITYGQTLSSSSLSGGTASVAGTFVFTNPVTIPDAGTENPSVTFIPTDLDNYNTASTSTSLTVNKATATVTLGSLVTTYDGTSKSATATTTPSGLTVNFTYDGSATAPTNAGTYSVVGTISDANYTGGASGVLIIAQASSRSYNAWVGEKFTPSQIAAGDSAATADPDRDGLTNLAEYALGGDPYVFTPQPTVTSNASSLSITFQRPVLTNDVIYRAESSSDFANWTALTLNVLTTGIDPETVRATYTYPNPNPPKKQFIRLRFEK